ncbi:hypothetical protein ACTHQ8_22195 [Lysinibacillus odysseyi]|nr:hypothetical protein [Lysinibacillus odysseyi]
MQEKKEVENNKEVFIKNEKVLFVYFVDKEHLKKQKEANAPSAH